MRRLISMGLALPAIVMCGILVQPYLIGKYFSEIRKKD
jgi:hypothetical protein